VNQSAAITFARHLTVKLSTSCSADTRASHSPSPGNAVAQTILDIYGPQLIERLASINRLSASSRMSQGTFDWDSEKSGEISKIEATAFRRVYSRRLKLVQRTSGSGCSSSLWATPRAAERQQQNSRDDYVALSKQVTNLWATPAARDYRDGAASQETMSKNARPLNEQAFHHFLPAPTTPTPGDTSSSDGPNSHRLWKTPHGFANQDSTGKVSGGGGEFQKQVRKATGKRKLNPLFVEWLMGLPIGWTGLEPVEMQSYPLRQQSLLSAYLQRLCGT